MTLKTDTELKKKDWFVVSKMTRISWILDQALASLKKLHFDWCLLSKVYNVWPKKVRRSYLLQHWRVIQNVNTDWFVVWKMACGLWQIFTRALKSVKIWILMRSVCPELKIYRGFMCTDIGKWYTSKSL